MCEREGEANEELEVSEKETEMARGGENLTPPHFSLEHAPMELVHDLEECGIPRVVIVTLLDVRPLGTDKRLTAPLAIRTRRARISLAELYMWAHTGMPVEDLINELNYLMGVSPRTLREYWEGIKRKGRVREVRGRVSRLGL